MKKIMIQKITQNNWNFWTVNLIMRAKKLLTSRQIFRYAVPARTVTKKHCLRTSDNLQQYANLPCGILCRCSYSFLAWSCLLRYHTHHRSQRKTTSVRDMHHYMKRTQTTLNNSFSVGKSGMINSLSYWGKVLHYLNKKLSYRRGIARCVESVEILPIATQQCRNYLYYKSWTNRSYEVGRLHWADV